MSSLPRLNPNAKFSISSPNLARLRAERDRQELARQDRVQAIRRANHLGLVDACALAIVVMPMLLLACALLPLVSN